MHPQLKICFLTSKSSDDYQNKVKVIKIHSTNLQLFITLVNVHVSNLVHICHSQDKGGGGGGERGQGGLSSPPATLTRRPRSPKFGQQNILFVFCPMMCTCTCWFGIN